MSTCPVCESPRVEGSECEVCGHGPGVPGRADLTVVPLEGLETTGLGDGASVGTVETLAELEPTLQVGAGAARPDPIPELEPTLAGPVDAVAELVPGLEPTAAAASGDPRTELPLFPVCRYCRTPAGPGERICGRCGIQLPLARRAAPPGTEAGPRFCSCGTPISRPVCPACGARNQVE